MGHTHITPTYYGNYPRLIFHINYFYMIKCLVKIVSYFTKRFQLMFKFSSKNEDISVSNKFQFLYLILQKYFDYKIVNLWYFNSHRFSPAHLSTIILVLFSCVHQASLTIKTYGSESRGQGGSTLRWPLDECT